MATNKVGIVEEIGRHRRARICANEITEKQTTDLYALQYSILFNAQLT